MSRILVGLTMLLVLVALGLAFVLITNQGDRLQQAARTSIQSRLVTVQQRCDFTGLMANEVVRLDPSHAAPFQLSLQKCEVQLKKLKKEALATP